jgi:AraC-like DNA-binding protein
MSYIRGTSLLGFPELVRELGGDPGSLLAAAHVPVDAVGDQDSFISYRGVVAVLEAAAATTKAGDFGRRLGRRQTLEILGPVGIAARTAANVGAAFAAIDQYMSVYSPALSARIDAPASGRLAWFDWRLLDNRPPPHAQSAELGLGVSLQIFRLFAGAGFTPVDVRFRHEPRTATEEYVEYFGCPVSFGRDRAGFTFHRAVLGRPLAADGAVHDVVRDYLNTIAAPVDAGTTEPVRLLIRRMLPTGRLSRDLVANHLAVHPRTLQRQLAGHGTTFEALVDEVRRDETERYLRGTDIPLGQLAGVVGYTEQSALTRACRRWFGVAPLAFRRQARVAAPPVAEKA